MLRYSAGAVLQIMLFGIMAIQVGWACLSQPRPSQGLVISHLPCAVLASCRNRKHRTFFRMSARFKPHPNPVHADQAQGAQLPHHPGSCPLALGKSCPFGEQICLISSARSLQELEQGTLQVSGVHRLRLGTPGRGKIGAKGLLSP